VRKEKRVTDVPEPAVGNGASAVGQRWIRTDAEAKVRGTFRYTADEPVGRVCFVGVHRASRPHARIIAVETEAARSVPGVAAVVTGADMYRALGDRLLSGPAFGDQPALAYDKVRYAGEPVAAVLAWDLATARAAADEVYVEYEDLEPVHDVDAAVAGGPFVHSELRPSAVFGDLAHLSGRTATNVNYEYNLRKGDVDAAVSGAATTVNGEFWSPPTHHVPIEVPCTTAWLAGDRLEVLSTTQTPSYVRQAIAELLDLRLNQVRVRTRPLGGSFGSKMYDRFEPLVAALAWLLRMPVRMEATREEAFLVTTRHGVAVTGQMSADADGNIVAASADVRYDTGAYADIGPRITAKSGMVACGPYRMEAARVRSRCVYTNKPSAGPYRGFGVPQVTFSHETLVDELARARGEDPAAYRRRQLLREGDTAVMGTVMHSADFVGCLDAATEAIGWDSPLRREEGSWRWGRGVAVGMKAVLTPTISNAVLQLNQDATATLLISTVDMGQGSDTIMAQIAAEVLCLGPGQVRVVAADTDVTPYDTITAGSRSTYHTGNAVRLAAERMRDRLIFLGAERLGVSATDCKLTAEGVVSSSQQRSITLPELIHGYFGALGTTLTTEANYNTQWVPYDHETGQSPKVTEHWFAGAVAAEVGVDTRTGRTRIRHVALAADVGRAINPTMVEQQLIGSAIMGTGQALFDYIVFDEGQMLNGTLLDYQLPSIKDVPDKITPIIIESPHQTGPFGAKGVGETVLIPFSPAIANAVRDAVGVRITTLPLTPERVLTALRDSANGARWNGANGGTTA
jgi:CO/xanthine dehydrogenase Mo-binding subunit